ncbi:MAG: LysM peptidoglycan-binding domain-containing protein [Spirochaetaceae bacterium]|nr:LysM peptidoglycan-binding domain-containing protein [Spirochaetaceae bacterium]
MIIAREQTHLVQRGETLYSISRMYNISLDKILVANRIEDPTRIRAGLNLIIPSNVTRKEYTVQRGDTLYAIARNHSISVNSLLEENNFNRETVIRIGQVIRIPMQGSQNIQVPNRHHWPVVGEMQRLSGKLQGSRILANYGDTVYSVSSGRVVWEGPYRGFGRVIFIESVAGYIYVYGGNDTTNVRVGDLVRPGTVLGRIGLSVFENRPTMFFAVYKDGKPVDVEKAPRL